MADVTVETEPRFSSGALFLIAIVLAIVLLAGWWALGAAAHVFDSTSTVVGADGKPVTESTFSMATAKFAVVAMLAFGSLLAVCGVMVALAEITKPKKATAPVPDPNAVGDEAAPVVATGMTAILVGIGEVAKAFATAVKDLKTSAMLVVMGVVLMVFGGAVAWQTIPDTNRNPTIEVPGSDASTTTTGGGATTTTGGDSTTTTGGDTTTTGGETTTTAAN